MSAAALLDGCRRGLDAPGALRDVNTRAKLTDAFNGVNRFAAAELTSSIPAVVASVAALRRALARELSGLLDNALCWTDEEQDCARWAAHATWRWASIAATAVEAASDGTDAAAAIGAALAICADSIKWHSIAALARPQGLLARAHRTYRLAEEGGHTETPATLEVDGATLSHQAQHLYLRVLLLDYLASGNLSRQQVEVADAWLLRWTREYALAIVPPKAPPHLWIDIARGDGLRLGIHEVGETVRYVSLESLPRQLASVERGFRSGRIFPDQGVSVAFRIENHIAVIDHFRRLVDSLAATQGARRAERNLVEGATVEVFHGVHEIVERGFAPVPRTPATAFKVEGATLSKRRDPLDALSPIELPRRWMSVRDASEGGLGLLAARGEHEEVCVGDLVAVREKEGGALAVGEVARRAPHGAAGGSIVGVQVRTRNARPVHLVRLKGEDGRPAASLDALFIPGADSSGRGDVIAVGDTGYSARARYEICFDDAVFVVSLNRVRRQGRGWLACGFEVLEQRRAA